MWKQIKEDQEETDHVEEQIKQQQITYPFQNTYPSCEVSHLKKQQHEVMSIISLPEGHIFRIQELEVCSLIPYSTTLENRKKYIRTALTMFLSFQSILDLQSKIVNVKAL